MITRLGVVRGAGAGNGWGFSFFKGNIRDTRVIIVVDLVGGLAVGGRPTKMAYLPNGTKRLVKR